MGKSFQKTIKKTTPVYDKIFEDDKDIDDLTLEEIEGVLINKQT